DALRPLENPEIALEKAKALTNLIVKLCQNPVAETLTFTYRQQLLDLARHFPSNPLIWEQVFVSLVLLPFVEALPKANAALQLLKINLPRLSDETEEHRARGFIEYCFQTIESLTKEEAEQDKLKPVYWEFMVLYPFIGSIQMAEDKAQATEAFFMYTVEQVSDAETNQENAIKNLQQCFQTLEYLSQNFQQSEIIQDAFVKIKKFVEDNFSIEG
ncbi:hypothetical protein, partial [Persicitalea jodogahamensis]|uniref:hypothetical protein n=1 Tax=Persicitalea jodogahamensis TaxID=402147 RepID=UPI001676E6BA